MGNLSAGLTPRVCQSVVFPELEVTAEEEKFLRYLATDRSLQAPPHGDATGEASRTSPLPRLDGPTA